MPMCNKKVTLHGVIVDGSVTNTLQCLVLSWCYSVTNTLHYSCGIGRYTRAVSRWTTASRHWLCRIGDSRGGTTKQIGDWL